MRTLLEPVNRDNKLILQIIEYLSDECGSKMCRVSSTVEFITRQRSTCGYKAGNQTLWRNPQTVFVPLYISHPYPQRRVGVGSCMSTISGANQKCPPNHSADGTLSYRRLLKHQCIEFGKCYHIRNYLLLLPYWIMNNHYWKYPNEQLSIDFFFQIMI